MFYNRLGQNRSITSLWLFWIVVRNLVFSIRIKWGTIVNLLNVRQKRRSERDFHEINDKEQINYLLQKYLHHSEVIINDFPEEVSVKIDFLSSGKGLHLGFSQPLPQDFSLRDFLVLSVLGQRYVEVTLKKLKLTDDHGIFEPVKAKIADDYRENSRIIIKNPDFLADNFVMAKYLITAELAEKYPFVHEIINNLKIGHKKPFQNCEFCFFDQKDSRRDIQSVQHTHKPVYIENTKQVTNVIPPSSDFLDYKAYLGSSFAREMEVLKTQRLRSLLVIPVLYKNLLNEKILIGCLRMSSHDKTIPAEMILRLYHLAETIVANINKINIIKINLAQKVRNISKTGIQLHISNDELAKYMSANPEEIILDIMPDHRLRFTLYGKIMNLIPEDKGAFKVGVLIIEHKSQHQILTKWYEFVDKYMKTMSY